MINSTKKIIIRKILFPIFKRIRNLQKSIDYCNFIKKREKYSIDENIELQKEKLFKIIDYSMNNIPFYQDFQKENNFTYNQDTIFEDIKKLPIITKEIIRENFDRMQNKNIKKIFKNSSGGSTGKPITFVQDQNYKDNDITNYFDEYGKYYIGDKLVRLWGSERDIFGSTKSLKGRIYNYLMRSKFLNTFRMSEKDMYGFVDFINKYKPEAIVAYVQSAYELARFIERNNLKIHSPNGIIASAGTVFPDFKKKIEEVFNCKVFSRYGSREIGNMAMECEKQEGLHLNILSHYIEILNESDKEVNDNEQGEIHITLLTNFAMPLIRYKIGDLAIKTSHKCSCNRGFPLIKYVTGRTVNIFKNKKGELIDGEYFTHLFYFIDFITQFQVIQEEIDRIVVNIVTKNQDDFEKNEKIFKDMEDKIKLIMGNDCKIEFKILKEILPSKSGKFIYTISKI